MKYVDEYRDEAQARRYLEALRRMTTRPWNIMEICGGQTHTVVKAGIDRLIPEDVRLVHGPGCPVCVTPLELIDKALAIARRPDVIFTSFGDMIRVPGSGADLLSVKAEGADVRIVYSPLDAVKIAAANPDRQVVFFAVGFETTAPANAMSVVRARDLGLKNYSILSSHTCWCLRPWRRSWAVPTTWSRGSWLPATCARSWATGSTCRSPRSTGSRWW